MNIWRNVLPCISCLLNAKLSLNVISHCQFSLCLYFYFLFIQYLSLCTALCPRAYTDEELLLLLAVVCRIGLETHFQLLPTGNFSLLLQNLLRNITNWDVQVRETVCSIFTIVLLKINIAIIWQVRSFFFVFQILKVKTANGYRILSVIFSHLTRFTFFFSFFFYACRYLKLARSWLICQKIITTLGDLFIFCQIALVESK